MKKRTALLLTTVVVVAVALVPLKGAVADFLSQSEAAAPQQIPPIPDLSTLLNYPYNVSIQPVPTGPERTAIIDSLMARPETAALLSEMEAKGFLFDPLADAEVMHITIETESGIPTELEAMTVTTIANELSGALTAMQTADGSEGFFQAHHTNLDPSLAEVPDPPIIYNGMPYFYITTLRWIGPWPGGRILYWHYWWFDSHHHPNWYYSHYYWYWRYYGWSAWPWPYWYWWVHGWYYWRYWYFWSTWFPWLEVDYPYPVTAP